MLATTLHMMQGTPYIYQGEEIGMTNPKFTSIEQYRDVESLNAYRMLRDQGKTEQEILDILAQKSRDNARTPMHWSAEEHAGFTKGTPWIPAAKNYREVNAEKAINDSDSIFYHYQMLVELHKQYDIITYGDYQLLLAEDPRVFAFTRNWQTEQLIVVSNFYGEETVAELSIEGLEDAELLLSNYGDNAHISDGEISLRPYESVVYHVNR